MKILYNALSTRTGGGFSYARDQVSALLEREDVEIEVITAPWNHELWLAADIPPGVLSEVDVPSVPLRVAWEQVVLPWRARGHDLLLSPGNMGPLWCPVPHVVILQNPNYAGAARDRATNRTFRRRAKIGFSHLAMRRADRVVAISESLAAEMEGDPGFDGVEVSLVRSGSPTPVEGDLDDGEAAARVHDLVGDEPYLLSVANDYPHKRLGDLGRLARLLVYADPSVPRRIVLAGSIPEPRRAEVRALAGDRAGSLVFLGPVTDARDVRALYRRSFASLSVSDLEAWPLTLLEARAEGAPLVVTDIPPHVEIAGSEATFFPVGDMSVLLKVLEATVDRDSQPASGPRRTWTDHAAELVEVLTDVTS